MTASLLDGKALAREIQAEVHDEVAEFIQNNGVTPCLAAVLVGEDPASEIYVRNKRRACERTGIESQLHRLPDDADTEDVLALVGKLNRNHDVHGILVQTPLPAGVDQTRVLDTVAPLKDVDAFHPTNVGLLMQGRPRFLPCTPHGIQQLLLRNGVDIAGRRVVIIGRSEIVGKPLAAMLMQRRDSANATVTVCHSRSRELDQITREAEILVVAVGRPRFVTAEMVRPGAAVIDVGIHRTEAGLVGDVDFEGVRQVAGSISPVPGGVGPLTVAMLLGNTLQAARLQLA